MTQEEKQLLLKDLCARLPYGVICFAPDYEYGDIGKLWCIEPFEDLDPQITVQYPKGNTITKFCLEVKPYLRSMSSMTDEEREEVEVFIFNRWYEEDSCKIDKEGWIEILANYDVSGIDPGFCGDYVDWLNAHHFDYRGLIENGLALEAPDGMYKTE